MNHDNELLDKHESLRPELQENTRMSDLQRRLAGKSLPRGLPPRPSLGSGARGGGARARGGARGGARRSYTGVSWRKYWRDKQLVATESRGTFCVYHGGSRESSVAAVLLHGAGYSGLTWSLQGDPDINQVRSQSCINTTDYIIYVIRSKFPKMLPTATAL